MEGVMNKKMRTLLYRSFDEPLTPKERMRLDEALEKSQALRREKQSIESMRRAAASGAKRAFRPQFSQRVMRRIRQSEITEIPFFEALIAEFRPLAIGAAVLVIALLSYNIIRSDQISLASAFAEPEITLEEVYDPTLMLSME
jgi:anti-sigma factor RsiW